MANREKGEVRLEAGGKVYRLVVNMNAMRTAEGVMSTPTHDVTWDEILEKAASGSVRHLTVAVLGMLYKFHPGMTLDEVGDLIDESGGLGALAHVLKSTIDASSPDPEDVKALPKPEVDDARPRTAQDGTGARSTETPAVLA